MPFHRQAASLALVGLLLSPALAGAPSAEPYPRQPLRLRRRRASSYALRSRGNAHCAPRTRRPASRSCDRRARRRACSAGRGAMTRTASGCRTAVPARSPPGRRCSSACRRGRRRPSYIPNAGFLLFTAKRARFTSVFSATSATSINATSTTPTPTRSATPNRAAAAGRAAREVLRAVQRLVPDAEVPLLPVRLVVERVAGRSRAGRRRRQPQLRVQPVRRPSAAASRRCPRRAAPRDSFHIGSASTRGRSPTSSSAARTPTACG